MWSTYCRRMHSSAIVCFINCINTESEKADCFNLSTIPQTPLLHLKEGMSFLPLHWNLLSGVVSSSLSAMSGGPVHRAIPGQNSIFPFSDERIVLMWHYPKTKKAFIIFIFLPGSLKPALTHWESQRRSQLQYRGLAPRALNKKTTNSMKMNVSRTSYRNMHVLKIMNHQDHILRINLENHNHWSIYDFQTELLF